MLCQSKLLKFQTKLSLSETLKARHDPAIIKISDFQLFRRDCLARWCGGVAILVKNECDPREIKLWSDDERSLKILWVKVKIPLRYP